MSIKDIYYGDILLADLEKGTGHEYYKERPVIVVESDIQIRKSSIITVIPLTSNLQNHIDNDILIKKDDLNRLRQDSIIKMDHIISIDDKRFINKIGVANKEYLEKIKEHLKQHFDL